MNALAKISPSLREEMARHLLADLMRRVWLAADAIDNDMKSDPTALVEDVRSGVGRVLKVVYGDLENVSRAAIKWGFIDTAGDAVPVPTTEAT